MTNRDTRRVTVFSREYPPVTVGGTSTVARNLSVGLAANGWRVTVVTTSPGSASDLVETREGVTIHRVGTDVVYNRDASVSDEGMRVHRRLHRRAVEIAERDGPPDVLALPDLFCLPEAELLARKVRAPLVNVLLQDFRTLTAYDHDRHAVTTGVRAEADHLFSIEEKSLRASDHTVFISHALSDAIHGYYPQVEFDSSVVHLGVDAAEIASVADAEEERAALWATLPESLRDRRLLVGCGRLVPVKGFAELLHAVALRDDPGTHLLIIGVGPEERRLIDTARALGIGDRVTFAGDIPRRTALTWMSMATVAVVPSLWESFCYVCAEMMALGRPVVATAIDSLNELIPDGSVGYRVPVQGGPRSRRLDPATLAGALDRAFNDVVAGRAVGAAARERVSHHFDNSRFGRAMSETLLRLVGNDG